MSELCHAGEIPAIRLQHGERFRRGDNHGTFWRTTGIESESYEELPEELENPSKRKNARGAEPRAFQGVTFGRR